MRSPGDCPPLGGFSPTLSGDDAISDRKLFRLIATLSAVWLGAAVLFFLFHRLGWRIALGAVTGTATLAVAIRYRLLPLGPLESWYEDYQYNRRMTRMRRLARKEQIEADPTNQTILYLQQFASPGLMRMLTPSEFFELVTRYFALLGYARRHQRISQGQATDAILRFGEDFYLLRSLRLDHGQAGASEVRALAAILERNRCVGGILATNLDFTTDAARIAEELNVALLDGGQLASSILAFRLRDPTAKTQSGRNARP